MQETNSRAVFYGVGGGVPTAATAIRRDDWNQPMEQGSRGNRTSLINWMKRVI